MDFKWILYVTVFASFNIEPSSSTCEISSYRICNYTVTCIGSLDRVKNPIHCGTEHHVSLVITRTAETILTKKFFSATNFDPRVRQFSASDNKWITISTAAFRYYENCIEMDLSNNHISTIQNSAFSNLLQLKLLNLSRNSIENLMPNAFDGMEAEVIDLSYNELTVLNAKLPAHNLTKLYLNNNKLELISEDSLRDLEGLNDLYLQHNLLKSLNKELCNLKQLITLDLSYNHLVKLADFGLKGVSSLILLNISHVHSLNLNNNYMSGDIIEYTFSGLSVVTKLELTQQSITGIKNKAFAGMEDLLSLNLSKNSIKIVDNTSFVDTPIRILDLSHNKLQELSFLKNCLTNLTEFSISDNDIQVISTNTFESQTKLVNLDLSLNKILKIEQQSLPLLNLQFLNISGNQLTGTVGKNVFSPAKYLRSLDLSYSNITNIGDLAFVDLPVLVSLNLSNNQIENVETSTFKGVNNMTSLDISYNKLITFKIANSPLNSLKALYLNHNDLTDTSETVSTNVYLDITNKILPNLTTLNLSHNKIKNFNNPQINTLSTLIDLKIASNELTTFNLSYFKDLKTVDLSNNNITYINSTLLDNLEYLQSFNISKNKIKIIPPGTFRFVKNLRYLNLSANFLSKLRHGSLSGLNSTEVLDISRNNLTSVDSEIFHECNELSTLIIDYNHIRSLDTRKLFLNVTKSLRTISLGGNPISCSNIFNYFNNVESMDRITSMDKIYHEENIRGIKCGDDSDLKSTDKPTVEGNSELPTALIILSAILTIILLCFGAIIIRNRFYKYSHLGYPVDMVSRTSLELN